MPTTHEYRRIFLENGELQEGDIENVVDSLNNHFPREDFYTVKHSNGIEIKIRQINISDLYQFTNFITNGNDTKKVITKITNAIENIRSYGIHGNKRLYVNYNTERKVINRKKKENERGKHYYSNKFDKISNDIPEDMVDQIICGDSKNILSKLPNNCVDLVFTSPPYNFGLNYMENNDTIDWTGYFDKLFEIFEECIRILKHGGRIVVNIQPLFSDYIPCHHIISNFFMEKGLIWKGEILWEKNNYNCKYTAWGSWKSPASPYLKYTWEFLEVFCKGSLKKDGVSANADIDSESFKEWVVAKWSIAPERKMKQFDHPAMFPEELAKRVLLLFSFKGDVVLDPFSGVGTTCVAAVKNNRKFLGIDIVPEYCDTARKRLDGVQLKMI